MSEMLKAEIEEQIKICEQLGCTITPEITEHFYSLKNSIQVGNYARTLKMSLR